MSRNPNLSYLQIVRALQRDGWIVVRQRAHHIRLQKRVDDAVLKFIVPTHKPLKRSTLARMLQRADLDLVKMGLKTPSLLELLNTPVPLIVSFL